MTRKFVEKELIVATHNAGKLAEMVDLLGLPKDDSVWFGTDLNDLDDWQGFHTAMLDDR